MSESDASYGIRQERQRSLFPELQVGTPDDVFSVDALRRKTGQMLTSLGRAAETVYAAGADALFFPGAPRQQPQVERPSLFRSVVQAGIGPLGAAPAAYRAFDAGRDALFGPGPQEQRPDFSGLSPADRAAAEFSYDVRHHPENFMFGPSVGIGSLDDLGKAAGKFDFSMFDKASDALKGLADQGWTKNQVRNVRNALSRVRADVAREAGRKGGNPQQVLQNHLSRNTTLREALGMTMLDDAAAIGRVAPNAGAAQSTFPERSPAFERLGGDDLLPDDPWTDSVWPHGRPSNPGSTRSTFPERSPSFEAPPATPRAPDPWEGDVWPGGRPGNPGAAQSTFPEQSPAFDRVLQSVEDTFPQSGVDQYQAAVAQALERRLARGEVPADLVTEQRARLAAMRKAQRAASGGSSDTAGGIVPTLRAINSMIRMVNTGVDVGYMGIQGSIAAFSNPRKFKQAATVSMRALRNPEARAAFIHDFDATRAAQGRPTSAWWGQNGLSLEDVAGEFTHVVTEGTGLGRIGRAVENAPIVRQTTRAFGAFGDALRLSLADGMYEEARLAGRTIGQRELASITKTANRMTGVTEKSFFGPGGDLINFAPRFFQARIESIAQLASRDPFERKLARQMLGRYVAVGTTMTVMANAAQGRATDFRPAITVDGKTRKNPNFMRIRAGGRDFTLFGVYDGLMGMAISAATGDLEGAARTFVSAPVAKTAWDLLAGETLTGTPTKSNEAGAPFGGYLSGETGQYLASIPAPFTGREGKAAIGQALSGDIGAAVASGITGATGIKGSLLTPTEKLDEVTPGGSFWEAPRPVQEQVKHDNPELWAAYMEKAQPETRKRADITTEAHGEQLKLDAAYRGEGDEQITIDQWEQATRELAIRTRALKEGVSGEKPKGRADDPPIVTEYWSRVEAATKPWGVDWRQVQKWQNSLTPEQRKLIDESHSGSQTPFQKQRAAVGKELEEARYFGIRDAAWEGIRERDPGLAKYESAEAFRKSMYRIAYRAEIDRGRSPAEAKITAEDRVEAMGPLEEWSKISNAVEERWILDHPGLAERAIEVGYIGSGTLRKSEKQAVLAP